jgi:hypothetical protein
LRLPSLRDAAVDLSAEGSSEYGFPQLIANEVFEFLINADIIPLGGDLWQKAVGQGFSSCGVTWFVDLRDLASVADRKQKATDRWSIFYSQIPSSPLFLVTFVV